MARVGDLDPQTLVEQFYLPLYRFAYSLSRAESDAWDLTQQTFYLWAKKGHQLRDQAKVKTWLFTTLYHEFLATRRKQERFEKMNDEQTAAPEIVPEVVGALDSETIQKALLSLSEEQRAPLTLFYLKSISYKEIAVILQIPIGTVMSRISRGKTELRKLLTNASGSIELKKPLEDRSDDA